MESSASLGTLTREQLALLDDAVRDDVAARADSSGTLPVLLGRYELREPIGKGGMGAVFKGWDYRLETYVAVKVARSGGTGRNDLRLLREARAAAAVHHEHVVGIRDVGEAEDGTPFVVMDYLEGEPLSAALAERARPPLSFALAILEQVAHGLQAAHEAGIVHRDLKPSNIFVTEREAGTRCTLIDFGLATSFEVDDDTRSLTKDGHLVGTPRYMSPEQISGAHPIGPATDIYSWGCVAFHLLSGTPPYSGTLHQLLHKHLNEPAPRLREVPDRLAGLVARCLSKDPRSRPQSALEIRTRLAVPKAEVRSERRGGWRTACAAGIAAGAVGWMAHTPSRVSVAAATLPQFAIVQGAVPCPTRAPELALPAERKPPEVDVAAAAATDELKPVTERSRARPKRKKRRQEATAPVVDETGPKESGGEVGPRSRAEVLEELRGLD